MALVAELVDAGTVASVFDPAQLAAHGFEYHAIGRGSLAPAECAIFDVQAVG